MHEGLYIVFEGPDGVGKSTVMTRVANIINNKYGSTVKLKLTAQPGSTPLGAHLRKLVKNPEEIDSKITIDPFSRQLLYMVDASAFQAEILIPSLENGTIVMSDRSTFISSIVYGMADGLSISDVSKLHEVVKPVRADKIIILNCPNAITRKRISTRPIKSDYFESKSASFFDRLDYMYNNLISISTEISSIIQKCVCLQDIVSIDASGDMECVIDQVVKIVVAEIENKFNFQI